MATDFPYDPVIEVFGQKIEADMAALRETVQALQRQVAAGLEADGSPNAPQLQIDRRLERGRRAGAPSRRPGGPDRP